MILHQLLLPILLFSYIYTTLLSYSIEHILNGTSFNTVTLYVYNSLRA